MLFNTISLTNFSPFLFEKKEERCEVGVAFLLPSVFMNLFSNLPYPAPQWEKGGIYREKQSTESKVLLLGVIGLQDLELLLYFPLSAGTLPSYFQQT